MKKYELKQWYPSLPEEMPVGAIVTFCYGKAEWFYHPNSSRVVNILKHELDNSDFWELFEDKKPLFITADEVEIFEGESFILVTDGFIKREAVACNDLRREGTYEAFKDESNADEYILWNKPLLSLHDIDVTVEGYLPEFDELKKLAEERVE